MQYYFFGGFFTLGMLWTLPAGKEYHHLVFSNGTLVGWDLPDPYAPDLIIDEIAEHLKVYYATVRLR